MEITKINVNGTLYDIPNDNTTYAAGTGVTITGTNNAINVAYGTTANTACAGNDTRLSNPRPASDVSGWAKAATKPSYSWSEITTKPTLIVDAGGQVGGTIYAIGCLKMFSGMAGSTNTEQNPRLTDAPVSEGWISGLALGSNWNNDHYQHYLVESGNRWYTTRSYQSSKMKDWNTFAYLSDIPTTLPASDVSAWAKAANKPSYAYSEIGYTVSATSSAGGTLSLAGTTPLHVVTLTGNISALTLSANPANGHSCHVIFTAAAEQTVAIAHDATSRVCPGAEDLSLTVPAGGYVEIDFLSANNKVYVRGV